MKNKETIEELLQGKGHHDLWIEGFIEGAEWQSERMYNDGDMQEYAKFCIRCHEKGLPLLFAKDYFEISINNNGL